jgi:lysozyme
VRSVNSKTTLAPKRRVNKKKPAKKKGKFILPLTAKVALGAVILIILSPFYYGYVIKTFTSTYRWVKDFGEDPNYRSHEDFNIRIPVNFTIHGIDVSSYQGKINWDKVREMQDDEVNVKFAFIKATEGIMHVDPYFQRNWREAPKAGIICGAYHYFKPQKNGKWQARFFLQNVKPEKGDLPMVVDIEELKGVSAAQMRKELIAFLKHIEEETHTKPIIYTNISFYRDYLQGYVDGYFLWVAHYYKSKLKVDKSTPWIFWQHSDKATIDGINHVVDMNVFHGDTTAFNKLLLP